MGSSLGAEGLVDRVSVDPTGCEMAVMTEAGCEVADWTEGCEVAALVGGGELL